MTWDWIVGLAIGLALGVLLGRVWSKRPKIVNVIPPKPDVPRSPSYCQCGHGKQTHGSLIGCHVYMGPGLVCACQEFVGRPLTNVVPVEATPKEQA